MPSSSGLGAGPIAGIVAGIIGGLLVGVAVLVIFWRSKRNTVLDSGREQPVEFDSIGPPMVREPQTNDVGGRLGTNM